MEQEPGFFQNPNTQVALIGIGIVASICCLLGSLAALGMTLFGSGVTIPGPTDITMDVATKVAASQISTSTSIPSPTERELPTSTPRDTPTPIPIEVEVIDVNWYTTTIDSFYLIGIVKNNGSTDLNYMKITAKLKDGQGQVVASKFGFTDIGLLKSGDISSFAVLFSGGVPDWDSYEITVEALEATEMDQAYNYTLLKVISSESVEPGYAEYAIQGEVKNAGQSDAEFVKVVAILYDEDDHIIGTDWTYTGADRSELDSGETTTFTLRVLNIIGPVDHYDLLVEGRRVSIPQ